MEDSGNSQSSTQQSTSSTSTDARVGADNGSVVIQAGGQQNISFSPEVAQFGQTLVNKIVDFSGSVLNQAKDIVAGSQATEQRVIQSSLDAQKSAVSGSFDFATNFGKSALAAAPSTSPVTASGLVNSVNTTSLKNIYLIAAVGGVVLLLLLMKRK